MHLPVPKAGLIGLTAILALVAALAVFVYSPGGNTAEAATYNPTYTAEFCNQLDSSFPVNSPVGFPQLSGNPGCTEGFIPGMTARDYTVNFVVPAGDSNFGLSVIGSSDGATTAGSSMADGTVVGGLSSQVTLGLLNGPCTTPLLVEFVLYDSELSQGNTVVVAPEGTPNRFASLVNDSQNDNLADSNSPIIVQYPDIYQNLLTTTGGVYAPPLARYSGATRVPPNSGDWQILSFFQMTPPSGSAFATDAADEPSQLGRVSHAPADGTYSFSVLNDPTATAISPSPIHDFCSPLNVQTMLLGTTSAGDRYLTPASGSTLGFSAHSGGLRDADGDGLENAFDTCPLATNTSGDSDFDGIDNACDTGGPGTDVDGDGFFNRQDNCPQIANGSPQLDSEQASTYILAAPDGGPQNDSIGDPCDPNPTTSFNEGAHGEKYNLVVKCIGGTDADGDNFCSTTDIDDSNAAVGGFFSNVGMDFEYTNNGGSLGDHGDGFGANSETYLGTDPEAKCGAASLPSDVWPADIAGVINSVNVQDVLALKPEFNTAVTTTAEARLDLVPSLSINIQDVLALKPFNNTSC